MNSQIISGFINSTDRAWGFFVGKDTRENAHWKVKSCTLKLSCELLLAEMTGA